MRASKWLYITFDERPPVNQPQIACHTNAWITTNNKPLLNHGLSRFCQKGIDLCSDANYYRLAVTGPELHKMLSGRHI